MYNIEQNQSNEHREGVQAVLVCLVVRDCTGQAFRIFGNTEKYSELYMNVRDKFCDRSEDDDGNDSHSDKQYDGINGIEQLQGLLPTQSRDIFRNLMLKLDRQSNEDEDEELLQSDSALIDVKS